MEIFYKIKDSLILSTLLVQILSEYLSAQVLQQFLIPRF